MGTGGGIIRFVLAARLQPGFQTPWITTYHIPFDLPWRRESSGTQNSSIGRELVEVSSDLFSLPGSSRDFKHLGSRQTIYQSIRLGAASPVIPSTRQLEVNWRSYHVIYAHSVSRPLLLGYPQGRYLLQLWLASARLPSGWRV